MAVYKVIQDIEAEDKLIGPLTLKSFIYAAIAGVLIFINVRILISGAPILLKIGIFLVFLLPMILFGILASPLGRDQPTEVWLLSHIRFFLKPHLRVWNQWGPNRLVTITVPKAVDKQVTKGYSQSEVQSRLQALATTLDSHGWAIKNSAVSLDDQQNYLDQQAGSSDRLVGASTLAQPAPVIDVHPSDDILDENNNATAQHFNELMQTADAERKQAIVDRINTAREKVNNIVSGSRKKAAGKSPATHKTTANTKQNLEIKAQPHSGNFHTKNPALAKRQTKADKKLSNTVTAEGRADRLELAQSGNDLSVASIAHLANRRSQAEQIDPNEVVISLH